MTQPTLFAGLNGDRTYSSPDGGGTLALNGNEAYGDGIVAGSQAFIAASVGDYLTVPIAGIITPQRGAIAVRVINTTINTDTNQWVLAVGTDNSAGQDFIGLFTNNANVTARFRAGATASANRLLGTITEGDAYTAYFDWDGTTVRYSKDTATLSSSTRTAPIGSLNTDLYIGGLTPSGTSPAWSRIDEIFVFDTIPTDDERALLFDTSRAWSWSMFAPASSRTIHPVLKIGAPHIGPLRVGERN